METVEAKVRHRWYLEEGNKPRVCVGGGGKK